MFTQLNQIGANIIKTTAQLQLYIVSKKWQNV